MKFLTGLCQDDVTTSIGDVKSRKSYSHVREGILGRVTEGILEICYGSGVTQHKVGLRVNSTPILGSVCVEVCMDGHGRLPGTYFPCWTPSSHLLNQQCLDAVHVAS